MNATKESDLEERINSILHGAIKWKKNEWNVKWNVIFKLCKSQDIMCEEAYNLLTKNLVDRKILSYSKEGTYDLFIMHTIPSGELLIDNNGKELYFTKSEYADAYKRLVFPSRYNDFRTGPAQ